MTQAELLQKIADKKNADAARATESAAKADKFATFATGLKKLCDEYGFTDHDDFVQQMSAYAGVTVKKQKVVQGPDVDEAAAKDPASDGEQSKGTNKNGSPRKPKTEMTQELCNEMKAYEESSKQSKAPTHKHFKLNILTVEKYRNAGWSLTEAKKNAKDEAAKKKDKQNNNPPAVEPSGSTTS
jgi:hypothetical protein